MLIKNTVSVPVSTATILYTAPATQSLVVSSITTHAPMSGTDSFSVFINGQNVGIYQATDAAQDRRYGVGLVVPAGETLQIVTNLSISYNFTVCGELVDA